MMAVRRVVECCILVVVVNVVDGCVTGCVLDVLFEEEFADEFLFAAVEELLCEGVLLEELEDRDLDLAIIATQGK